MKDGVFIGFKRKKRIVGRSNLGVNPACPRCLEDSRAYDCRSRSPQTRQFRDGYRRHCSSIDSGTFSRPIGRNYIHNRNAHGASYDAADDGIERCQAHAQRSSPGNSRILTVGTSGGFNVSFSLTEELSEGLGRAHLKGKGKRAITHCPEVTTTNVKGDDRPMR